MSFLAGDPDITPITNLITTWIHIGQALVGSIGALAFIFAFLRKFMETAVRGGPKNSNAHTGSRGGVQPGTPRTYLRMRSLDRGRER